MKIIYSTSIGTYFNLYNDTVEERTEHLLFWGLFSFTTKKVFTNKTV